MYEITIENDGKIQKIHEISPESNRRLSSGRLIEEINQIPSFSFTIPASNPCYSDALLAISPEQSYTVCAIKNTQEELKNEKPDIRG